MQHSYPLHPCLPRIVAPRRASARELISRVAFWHGETFETLIGPRGPSKRCEARFDAIVAVRQSFPNMSKCAIGRLFGGRDHSTVWHALKKRGAA